MISFGFLTLNRIRRACRKSTHGTPRLLSHIASNPLDTDQISADMGIRVDWNGQCVGEIGKICIYQIRMFNTQEEKQPGAMRAD